MRMRKPRRNANDYFGWEMVTATIWSVVIAAMLLGATYHRLGRPAVEWSKASEVSVPAGTMRLM